MEQRIYHGNLSIDDIARAIISHFNRGNYRVQEFVDQGKSVVQIATSQMSRSGGMTSLTISMEQVEDGASIHIGAQDWMGTAASIGQTAFSLFLNPISILGRLDDIAQDIENLQLTNEVWKVIDETAAERHATFQLSERLSRLACSYCGTANPVGQSNCLACGAPLGEEQPITCTKCGFVMHRSDRVCQNCGQPLGN
jgi:hypothetical protein